MGDTLRSLLRGLLRIDRKQDPLLERYLQRNREALERQRMDFGQLTDEAVVETVDEEPVEELREEPVAEPIDIPKVFEEQLQETRRSIQSELPLKYQNTWPGYETSEGETQESMGRNEEKETSESG
jgi:hypothetical protein